MPIYINNEDIASNRVKQQTSQGVFSSSTVYLELYLASGFKEQFSSRLRN